MHGNKGKILSVEHKEKLRQAKLKRPVRYWLGKKRPDLVAKGFTAKGTKHTEERKIANSKRMKGNKHAFGHTSWNKGKKYSKEFKAKLSDAHKGQVSQNKGKKIHSEESKRKNREWHLANPCRQFKDTSIELKIEDELRRRGINYQKQVPLCKIARVDFYLPEYRLVIQADGCYWHNCFLHGRGERKNCSEKDRKQDTVLTFNGFNVYRFWEHEINESVKKCIDRINLI